jgi:hypothetical protein
MRKIRWRYRRHLREIAGNTCTAAVFVICDSDDRYAIEVAGHPKIRSDGARADSESRFLAIKKFSQAEPRRLISARQTPIFARIEIRPIRGDSARPTPQIVKHRE